VGTCISCLFFDRHANTGGVSGTNRRPRPTKNHCIWLKRPVPRIPPSGKPHSPPGRSESCPPDDVGTGGAEHASLGTDRYQNDTMETRNGGTEDGRAKVSGRRTDRHGEAKSGSKSAMMMRNSWRLERRASWRMAAQRRNAAPAHETPPHHFSTAFPSVSPFPYYHTDFQPWLTLRSSLITTRRRCVDH